MNPRRPWEHENDTANGHDHDPDPMWDLGDFDDDRVDDAGRRRIPLWVIIIAVLIALALILQLAWPLVMELIDNGDADSGFPTPGTI